jgi:hypothetical protein
MRIRIGIAAALVLASAHVTAAKAQQVDVAAVPLAASALTALPPSLEPDARPASDEAEARIPARRFVVSVGIGALAGAGAGLVIGAITTDGCQPDESWCILGWEEEVAIHGVAGAMVGAGIGAVYALASSPGRSRAEPAPVTVMPATDGGLRVGVTLRH